MKFMLRFRLLLVWFLFLSPVAVAVAEPSFVEFERGHVRPVTLHPDGSQLLVVNTPDNTLEIFDVGVGTTIGGPRSKY